MLNINGDTVAGEIAAAIGGGALVYLTDVAGIRGADGAVITQLTPEQAQTLMNIGVASGGMIPKLKSCLVAAGKGVVCRIVDGRQPHALSAAIWAIFTVLPLKRRSDMNWMEMEQQYYMPLLTACR